MEIAGLSISPLTSRSEGGSRGQEKTNFLRFLRILLNRSYVLGGRSSWRWLESDVS